MTAANRRVQLEKREDKGDFMPKISVIVPVYKVEAYLGCCIDSILDQTYADFELILVDDGSPDNCGAICDEYAAKDSRIVVIHQPNCGVAVARNAALRAASGEYLTFVDSDDWVDPDYLEYLLHAAESADADMAMCGVEKVWVNEGTVQQFPLVDQCLSHQEAVSLIETSAWYHAMGCSKLWRSQIFEDIRFREGYVHEDEAVFHRLIGQCSRVMLVSRPMYHYRQLEDSIMGRKTSIRRTDKLWALADRVIYSRQQNWDRVFSTSAVKYTELFFDYYLKFPMIPENEIYYRRMEETVRMTLPYILRCKQVGLKHKLYLALIRINPKLYIGLRNLVER